MGSSRLPKKVILNIQNKPLILYLIDRLKIINDKNIDLIVATTTSKSDDPLCKLLKKNNIPYFRGSELDVFSRFLECAKVYLPKFIVRINADCPLICPKLVKETIDLLIDQEDYDYASTILDETFPLGMHVEVFKFDTLIRLNSMKLNKVDREHVTPKIYNNPQIFKLLSKTNVRNDSDLRLTVDHEVDLKVVRAIAKNFNEKVFYCDDIVNFLRNNSRISRMNLHLMKRQTISN